MTRVNSLKTVRSPEQALSLLPSIPILIYHKIDPRGEPGITCISPRRLEQHLALFGELGYQSITFVDLLTRRNLPTRALILTFDDGYASVYEQALPLLSRYGYRGVVFVISGFLGRWNTWDVNPGGIRFRHLTAGQLRQLHEAGWEIGCHSHTHRDLRRLNERGLIREIDRSRKELAEVFSGEVLTFAYPFGLHNGRVREAVREAGFGFGVRGIRGGLGVYDRWQIPRIPVYAFESLKAIRKKLSGQQLPRREYYKLWVCSAPAGLTPWFQRFFKSQLLLDM